MNTNPSDRAAALVGVAFEIADLVLLQAWADLHGMRMIVELDHCVDGHEYEEIVAIYAKGTEHRRWNLWRSWDEVIVQPLIGRSMHFSSVSEATEALSSKKRGSSAGAHICTPSKCTHASHSFLGQIGTIGWCSGGDAKVAASTVV